MLQPIQAIYENGVLRPLQPVSLQEREVVLLTLQRDKQAESDSPSPVISPELQRLLDLTAKMPMEAPLNGFSNRDHDKAIYRKP